ncbi:circularly permuted type 2 ATP-grasp protein [Cellulomonas cellasea]|uniref:Putative circularly permuted ATP-grasp superfamily protein/putative alpha-E superfamily protein n=1 Tax=Cellulomonas cellasea TaxID=43670 RepID=A0A7W4YB79_9CELL|nr:circularly permuted type 2 ATP-grasp protein [Cellulomonas cellasea]MBB2923393.1 putative circularly permuted ATP-grasp superfamily protein/putative alpha-E superfamily protein [Cellulomonas cellasea]
MTDLLSSVRAPAPDAPDAPGSPDEAGADRRPDWSWLPDAADAPTEADLARYRDATDRLLADHGVTYGGTPPLTADGAPTAGAAEPEPRSWRLDPVPVIVDEHEWSVLERALVQRTELLDAVLQDVYGPRRLLGDGLLPPELVLAHPGYLRAVHGLRLPGPHELVLTATDVTRDASGAWTVVADRTQAPSGAGYAMEDRRVVAQVLAGVYRQASIQRIGPFFHALRLALAQVAPPGTESPRIVLLTAGPQSETAFDQAYLSSMLGLPLVEGSDLVVRDGRVWMRGLDELEPVDVVLRRVDADFCDPLELRSDSRLGVPGLVRALRAGTVSVVNPLGSSVLENPALHAYLPRLARTVLGTDLALRSPETFWCGDPVALRHVLAHLDELVLAPTYRGMRSGTVHGWTLGAAERAELAARIAADPLSWVGQEPVATAGAGTGAAAGAAAGRPGSAPAPTAAVLRTFAVARRGSYQVMSGGLARVFLDDADERPAGSDAAHDAGPRAYAKDVWVLSSEPDAVRDPWLHAEQPAQRVLTGISPRTAENMFWMGRYAERAGDKVRVLRAVVDRWDDYHRSPRSAGGGALAALLAAVGADEPASWRTEGTGTDLRALLLDRARPGSVASSVRRLAEASAAVRDQLSNDTWLPLASLDRALADERRLVAARDRLDDARQVSPRTGPAETVGMRAVLDRMLEALLAVAGIGAESMVRDLGWRFLDGGRRLERAQFLVDTLAATLTTQRSEDVDSLVLESLLIEHESVITYRRRNQAGAAVATVLDLLLLDRTNPRSLGYQLDRLREDLAGVPVPVGPAGHVRSPETRDRLLQDVADLLTELDTATVAAAVTEDGRRDRLAEVLDSMRWRLRAVGDEIARVHFVHPAPSRSLDDAWGAENTRAPDADDGDDRGPA